MSGNDFEAFSKNPDLVVLLTFENLSGTPFIRQSERASLLNRLAVADQEQVLH